MKASNILLTVGLVYLVYRLTNKLPSVSKIDQSIINSKTTNISDCNCGCNANENISNEGINYYQPQTIDFAQLVPTPASVFVREPLKKFKPSFVC
jgi:hypothetical protein